MANTTQPSVVAVFDNNADAQSAADDLTSHGFDSDDIYISSESAGTNAAAQTGYAENQSTTGREGGFTGWLKSIFGADDEADRERYENAVGSGKVVLSVQPAEEDIDEVVDILDRHSPIDVHEGIAQSGRQAHAAYAGTPGTTFKGTQGPTGAQTTKGAQSGQSQAIPVVKEELRVGKRSVQRGGVRIYSRVSEQPVEESVNLREEQVRVERRPVDRPATEADLRAREQQVVEVKEYAEEPVVSKEARVVEEVHVSKEATERTEKVKDTVRRTEVDVENLEKKGPQSSTPTEDPSRAKSAGNR